MATSHTSKTVGTCDKCGQPVPAWNDTTLVQAYAFGHPLATLVYAPRHFLPTETCEGSPSRAQYIEGQPRDTRGFRYVQEHEEKWRKGFAEAQREHKS